jgi:hypothetical protein
MFTKYDEGDQSKENEMSSHVAHMVEIRSAYKILTGKAEGERQLSRHRPRWGIILKWVLKK